MYLIYNFKPRFHYEDQSLSAHILDLIWALEPTRLLAELLTDLWVYGENGFLLYASDLLEIVGEMSPTFYKFIKELFFFSIIGF